MPGVRNDAAQEIRPESDPIWKQLAVAVVVAAVVLGVAYILRK